MPGYQQSDHAQFLLFVEQLDEACQLVETGTVAKLRMALVAADNLAEVVLHRHKERILKLADDSWRHQVPRLSKTDLSRLGREFHARVELGSRGADDPLLRDALRPLLDNVDVAIFRTGHAYRGRVYHADHHNPTVLPLITQAYLAAVGRAFIRQQPENVAASMPAEMRERVAALGYQCEQDSVFQGWMFAPADAARAIIARTLERRDVALVDAARALGDDLGWRAEWADNTLRSLLSNGLTVDRLAWALDWGEFWVGARTDDEVVALDRELADVWAELTHSRVRADGFDRIAELQTRRTARVQALRREFAPVFDPGEIDRLRRLGTALSNARSTGALFKRYEELDRKMERVERLLHETAIGWEQHLEAAGERARGN